MTLVPTIDISAWGRDEETDRAIAAQVDAGCRSVGFLSITGHSVSAGTLESMLAAVDEFFAQPESDKQRYGSPSPDINRGYAAKETEALSLSLGIETPPDLFEAFNVGIDGTEALDPAYRAKVDSFFAPNIWPSHPASFRSAVVAYFAAAARQAAQLMEILAVALGEDRHHFDAYTSHSTDTMRINHFSRSPGQEEPQQGQQRMGAHTDYGMVTVLYADSVPGLQIVDPDGDWHAMTPEPGSLLVNLGDLMATWTNDRWVSSLHRVVPPPRQLEGAAVRRSVAFFRDGNHDALIECLPSCTSADNPPRYDPINAGDHLMAKVLGPRTQAPSMAVSTAGDRIAAVQRSGGTP